MWESESPEGRELAGPQWGSVLRLYEAEMGAGGSIRALRARPSTFSVREGIEPWRTSGSGASTRYL